MNRRDGGYVLPMTIVTLTLLAFAALLTGRAVGAMLRASVQERLIITEQQATGTAEAILDAWMADETISAQIIDSSQPHHNSILGTPAEPVWRTPEGNAPCPTATETTCWRIVAPLPAEQRTTLRGGEAERVLRVVALEVVTGCYNNIDNCQRSHTTTREYEQAVFAQYQLHFASHQVPPGAVEAARRSLTTAEVAARQAAESANPSLTIDEVNAEVAADPAVIEWAELIALLQDPGAEIVFADGDTFNGPVRTSLTHVLFCGSPTFKKPVEVSLPKATDTSNENDPDGDPTTDDSLIRSATLCASRSFPNWWTQVPGERIVAGGTDSLLISGVNSDGTFNGLNVNSTNNQPCCPSRAAQPGVYAATGNVILDAFTVSTGSVTVYATGDITIRGNVEAIGVNSAGGPNVVALISETGDIIIDPNDASTTALCLTGNSHSLNLTNVAVLAPNGALFAPAWHKETCTTPPAADPILRFEGSLAAKHLGVYGQLADDGSHISGWTKKFCYPDGRRACDNLSDPTAPAFWLARPPWWPDFNGNEWASTEVRSLLGGSTANPTPPQPGLTLNQTSLTVSEESSVIVPFEVRLATQPTADVTVNVRQLPTAVLSVNPSTLVFTPADWDTAKRVTVDASAYTDTDTIDNRITVTLTADSTDIDYYGLTQEVAVMITDDDIPALVVSAESLPVEENSTATFTASLATAPTSSVTVTVSVASGATAATVSPTTLTFTTSNYGTGQTVTVTAVDDPDADDEALSVLLTATSTDSDYDTKSDSVAVTVTDDDESALVVTPPSVTVAEGSTGTFDVELATQPTQQVTVTLATNDTTAATVTPASLTFTTSNWDTAQTVTVTGAQDDDTNDETTTASLTASGGDYSRQTATVAVTVTDDDTPVLLSRFTATDAAAYVATRDALVDESKNGASFLFGTSQYVSNYLDGANYWRSRNGLDPDIPLGEDDPNSLPDPTTIAGQEDLRDAIDALAVAAGLLQSMIDAAEGG